MNYSSKPLFENKALVMFLGWAYGIAWGTGLLLILVTNLKLLPGKSETIFRYAITGAGVTAAPAYTSYLVFKKYGGAILCSDDFVVNLSCFKIKQI